MRSNQLSCAARVCGVETHTHIMHFPKQPTTNNQRPTTNNQQAVGRKVALVLRTRCRTSAVDIMMDVERDCGAAKRRRERQLRLWLKHERQTVHGPCRNLPPLPSTVPAEVQRGVGGKLREPRRPTGTEDGKDQGGQELHAEDQCGRGHGVLLAARRGRRRVRYAGRDAGAAGTGSAAHGGANHEFCSHSTDC